MKIPVFISCPIVLNAAQEEAHNIIIKELEYLCLEPRSLGRSDYPTDLPLREVYVLGTHCAGGIILGFEQFYTEKGVFKRNTNEEKEIYIGTSFPSPWNHIEAGVLFGLGLPLLVFRENNISGGIFDNGVTDVFVHRLPDVNITQLQKQALREVFLKWQSRVRNHYYRDKRNILEIGSN